jgi:hypothetical protein
MFDNADHLKVMFSAKLKVTKQKTGLNPKIIKRANKKIGSSACREQNRGFHSIIL